MNMSHSAPMKKQYADRNKERKEAGHTECTMKMPRTRQVYYSFCKRARYDLTLNDTLNKDSYLPNIVSIGSH